MKLEKAVKLLQGKKFDMVETFWSNLGGEVDANYIVKVVDAKTLLNDFKELGFDLDKVTGEDDLIGKVADGLYDLQEVGSDGVE